ncbi:MAG: hypothetical protein ACYC7L_01245 [Nitrospirota bacterium]
MKRLQNKITDTLADAALLEMGVDVQTTAVLHSWVEAESNPGLLKRFFRNVTNTLADAALLEMGVQVARPVAKAGTVRETLEENLIEVAFAEAADYDDIHKAILREHQDDRDIAHPDDCQYGDNDLCFTH